jgi:hypothetical protein
MKAIMKIVKEMELRLMSFLIGIQNDNSIEESIWAASYKVKHTITYDSVTLLLRYIPK